VHHAADQLSTTPWFWTVDGDNWLLEPLIFDAHDMEPDLIMFHAVDPITKKWTKLGGPKLWRRGGMAGADMRHGDFCLNATREKTTGMLAPSETRYNSSPYDAWKTSFRHVAKLRSSIIAGRPLSTEAQRYLSDWNSTLDLDDGVNNGVWAWRGACDAEAFVASGQDVFLINDYKWLTNYYHNLYTTAK
jgi:hypothetical protein